MKIECPRGSDSEMCVWKKRTGEIRDAKSVGIKECEDCQLVVHNENLDHLVSYSDGSMHDWTSGYGENLIDSSTDSDRRLEALKKLASNYNLHTILDFGCGQGAMVNILNESFKACGLEPEFTARKSGQSTGLVIYDSLDEISKLDLKFDAITMFHVMEHIYEPNELLKTLLKFLNPEGLLIIETPNSMDALLTFYKNYAFQNFTYWSHHPMLYSNKSLELAVSRAGFKVLENGGVQRYKIANHLYWLSVGKPGGHEVWKDEFQSELDELYASNLVKKKQNDTLWLVAQKLDL